MSIRRSSLYLVVAESDGHPRRSRRSDQQTSGQSGRVQSLSRRIQDHSRVSSLVLLYIFCICLNDEPRLRLRRIRQIDLVLLEGELSCLFTCYCCGSLDRLLLQTWNRFHSESCSISCLPVRPLFSDVNRDLCFKARTKDQTLKAKAGPRTQFSRGRTEPRTKPSRSMT